MRTYRPVVHGAPGTELDRRRGRDLGKLRGERLSVVQNVPQRRVFRVCVRCSNHANLGDVRHGGLHTITNFRLTYFFYSGPSITRPPTFRYIQHVFQMFVLGAQRQRQIACLPAMTHPLFKKHQSWRKTLLPFVFSSPLTPTINKRSSLFSSFSHSSSHSASSSLPSLILSSTTPAAPSTQFSNAGTSASTSSWAENYTANAGGDGGVDKAALFNEVFANANDRHARGSNNRLLVFYDGESMACAIPCTQCAV